jgi:hypothetical protein
MRALPLCLLTIGVALWPCVADADPIRIVLDRREASAQALIAVGTDLTNVLERKVASDDLSASVNLSRGDISGTAAATLSSSVAAHQIAGMGTMSARASVFSSAGTALTYANSEVILLFELDRLHLFDFNGLFDATSGVGSDADLSGPFSLMVFQTPPMSSGRVHESGRLPAGVWGLRVFQTTTLSIGPGAASEHGQFSFTFDLTPTPEPGSFVLLGSGLLGLLTTKRRRLARH